MIDAHLLSFLAWSIFENLAFSPPLQPQGTLWSLWHKWCLLWLLAMASASESVSLAPPLASFCWAHSTPGRRVSSIDVLIKIDHCPLQLHRVHNWNLRLCHQLMGTLSFYGPLSFFCQLQSISFLSEFFSQESGTTCVPTDVSMTLRNMRQTVNISLKVRSWGLL